MPLNNLVRLILAGIYLSWLGAASAQVPLNPDRAIFSRDEQISLHLPEIRKNVVDLLVAATPLDRFHYLVRDKDGLSTIMIVTVSGPSTPAQTIAETRQVVAMNASQGWKVHSIAESKLNGVACLNSDQTLGDVRAKGLTLFFPDSVTSINAGVLAKDFEQRGDLLNRIIASITVFDAKNTAPPKDSPMWMRDEQARISIDYLPGLFSGGESGLAELSLASHFNRRQFVSNLVARKDVTADRKATAENFVKVNGDAAIKIFGRSIDSGDKITLGTLDASMSKGHGRFQLAVFDDRLIRVISQSNLSEADVENDFAGNVPFDEFGKLQRWPEKP